MYERQIGPHGSGTWFFHYISSNHVSPPLEWWPTFLVLFIPSTPGWKFSYFWNLFNRISLQYTFFSSVPLSLMFTPFFLSPFSRRSDYQMPRDLINSTKKKFKKNNTTIEHHYSSPKSILPSSLVPSRTVISGPSEDTLNRSIIWLS